MPNGFDECLEKIREAFEAIDHFIHVPLLEMLVDIPKGDENGLYDLSGAYADAATLYNEHARDVAAQLTDLYASWSGDGTAQYIQQALEQYLEDTSSVSEAFSGMSELVNGGGNEIESTKYMAVISLIMLLITLIQVIVTLWCTFGLSSVEGAGAITVCREALATGMRELIAKINALVAKGLAKGLWDLALAGLKAGAKTAINKGLQFAAFTAASQGGILTIETLEGHHPDWRSLPGQIADGFITGLIGGPLSFGAHGMAGEALAMGGGQFADNLLKMGRSDLLDAIYGDARHVPEWAQAWGLYSMPASLMDGVGTGALFGAVSGAGAVRESLPELLGRAQAGLGLREPALGELFAPAFGLDPAALGDLTRLNETAPEGLLPEAGTGLGPDVTPPARLAPDIATRPGAGEPGEPVTATTRPVAVVDRPGTGGAEGPKPPEGRTSERRPGDRSAAPADGQTSTTGPDEGGSGPADNEFAPPGDEHAAPPASDVPGGPDAGRPPAGEPDPPAAGHGGDGTGAPGGGRGELGTTGGGHGGDTGLGTPNGGHGGPGGDGRTEPGTGTENGRAGGDADRSHPTEPSATPTEPGAKPRFREWHQKVADQFRDRMSTGYGERIAQEFLGPEGRQPLTLRADMVNDALRHDPADLGPFGRRLRQFMVDNLSTVAADGTRIALDEAGIRARLGDLGRFSQPTTPAGARPTGPAATEPTEAAPTGRTTAAGAAAAERETVEATVAERGAAEATVAGRDAAKPTTAEAAEPSTAGATGTTANATGNTTADAAGTGESGHSTSTGTAAREHDGVRAAPSEHPDPMDQPGGAWLGPDTAAAGTGGVPADVAVDGGTWTARLPDDTGPAALDIHVRRILDAASDPRTWPDDRPPRIVLRADGGIDAELARHLEHLRGEPPGVDAAGEPVPAPRVEVVGPRNYGDPLPLNAETREQDIRDGVPYFDEAARARFEVRVVDGRLYDGDDVPLHGEYTFVTDPTGRHVYAMDWHEAGRLDAKHSSFLAGGEVLTAGVLHAEAGRLTSLDNTSGHYRPGADHLYRQVDIFAQRGVDLSGTDPHAVGPVQTPHGTARGNATFDRAITELNRPAEIPGVRSIERIAMSVDGSPDHPGTTLRVTMRDGRVVEIDASGVHDFLAATRPEGEDLRGYPTDTPSAFTSVADLDHQGADLLRTRIAATVEAAAEPAATLPARVPHQLIEVDRALAAAFGDRPLFGPGPDRPGAPAHVDALARSVRELTDAQIRADVEAAGLPPHEAAALTGALVERRDAVLAGYAGEADPEAVAAWADRSGWIDPGWSGARRYDELRYQADAFNAAHEQGLTVHGAARALDEASARAGRPGGYEWALDDFLRTAEGAALHDGLTHLDLATSAGPRGQPTGGHVTEPDAGAMLRAGRDRLDDLAPAVRAAIDRYARFQGGSIDAVLRSDAEPATRQARHDAFALQSAMEPSGADALLHGGVNFVDLGISGNGGLTGLIGENVRVDTFLRATTDALDVSWSPDVRLRIEAPAGTREVWLGEPTESGGATALLAAGTELRVVDLTRIGNGRYELHVRVEGHTDPPALTGRLHPATPIPTPAGAETQTGAGGDALLHRHEDGPSNAEVLAAGPGIPMSPESVARVAGAMGIDLAGVRLEIVTDAAEVAAMDDRGISATTFRDGDQVVVQLGPAAFADARTLAKNVAHEWVHLEQLRSGVEVTPENKAALEHEAYAGEDPYLRRFDTEVARGDDPVLGGEGLGPEQPQGPAGGGLGAGRDDRAGNGAGGPGRSHDDGAGGGVPEPGGPAVRSNHPVAGAHDAVAGGAGDDADRGEQPGGPGTLRVSPDLRDGGEDTAAADGDGLGGDAGSAANGPLPPRPETVAVQPQPRGEPALRRPEPGTDAAGQPGGGGGDLPGHGDEAAQRNGPAAPGAVRGGEPAGDLTGTTPHEAGTGSHETGTAPNEAGSRLDEIRRRYEVAEQAAREMERHALASLDDATRQKIVDAVGEPTQLLADHTLDLLRDVQARMAERGVQVEIIGEDHRVKGAASLARKFVEEYALDPDLTVEKFLTGNNDTIRFSMKVPMDSYGASVRAVLEELTRPGPDQFGRPVEHLSAADQAKNFWARGNRFYGLNLTLREPGGHLMELQFPTDISFQVGKVTHGPYEVLRLGAADFAARVDAFLDILRINREFRLPDALPDLTGLPEPKLRGFAEWIRQHPAQWEAYQDSLAADGRTFLDVLRDAGLTPSGDIPRGEHLGLPPDSHPDDDALNRLFRRRAEQPAPEGRYRPGLDFKTLEPPRPEAMPEHPNEAYHELHQQVTAIVEEQRGLADSLAGDGKYWFARVYQRVTENELAMIDRGAYTYPIMKLQEVVSFHASYATNLAHWVAGEHDLVEPNWRIAFAAAERASAELLPLPSLKILHALLPAMQAHIQYDLPRAIAAVYQRYYAGRVPFEEFRADFDRMQPVFDRASQQLLPEIADATLKIDPGQYQLVQDLFFRRMIYDIPTARADAWQHAGLIVEAHQRGITDEAGVQRHIVDSYAQRGPFALRVFRRIAGRNVDGYDWSHQPGPGGENVIHASAVPGSDFRGHVVEASQAHQAELLAQVPAAMDQAIGGHGGATVTDAGDGRYEIRLADGHTLKVRVETQWLGDDAAAGSHLRHDTGEHVIQLSDQLATEYVDRAVAHEVGEIIEDRLRYLRGEPADLPDALASGEPAPGARISPHDAGRIAELRLIGAKLLVPNDFGKARRDGFALVDHLGLRDGEPGAAARRELALRYADPVARADVEHALDVAARAPEHLTPPERAELVEVRAAAAGDAAHFAEIRATLEPRFDRPVPFDGRIVTPAEARALADEATALRAARSRATLADLRAQQAALPSGRHPMIRLELGGGAALAGRDPGALLVDARGRWQADNGTVIAQSADQLRNLNRTGLGDPYQFTAPGERVSLDAVRYWEDTVAATGPVVDGEGTLRIEDGILVVDVTPGDGSPPITLEVEGVPTVATGFPPETVVGVDRTLGSVYGAFQATVRDLRAASTPAAEAAAREVGRLDWNRPGSARAALDILDARGVDRSVLTGPALRSLTAIGRWQEMRAADPHGVLTGDEANTVAATAGEAHRWLVVGTGGTAISGIENIARRDPRSSFEMVGTSPPRGIDRNPQWTEVRRRHDKGFNPEHPGASSDEWPDHNPTATGRLRISLGRRIEQIEENTVARYAVGDRGGDGVIVSISGRNAPPPAITTLVASATVDDPGAVRATFVFDDAGQYLGYRLTVAGHDIDVTGAASRFFPDTPLFTPVDGEAFDHPGDHLPGTPLWATSDPRYVVIARTDPPRWPPPQAASLRDAPLESGNFDGGYVATAVQVAHYAAAMRSGR